MELRKLLDDRIYTKDEYFEKATRLDEVLVSNIKTAIIFI